VFVIARLSLRDSARQRGTLAWLPDRAVVRDLQRQRLHGLLQRRHPGLNLGKVLLEHLAPFADAGVPLASKPGEGLHALDGHAGLAQAQQEGQPVHVGARIAALAARCARHRGDQADALVVPQRVGREARALGDFRDAQAGFHGVDCRN
jgi:hypothetical protein